MSAPAWLDVERAVGAYLVAFIALATTALGALLLLLTANVARTRILLNARAALRPVAAPLLLLPLAALPLVFTAAAIYPWAGDDIMAAPHLATYFDPTFLALRSAIWIASWLIALRFARSRGASAVALIVVTFTGSFAMIDWLMSLRPEWRSTVYPFMVLSGGLVAVFGALAILAHFTPGTLTGVRATEQDASWSDSRDHAERNERLRALGNLMLTFVLLRAYVGYMQYLIIWSADLPVEVPWYLDRRGGGWDVVAILLIGGYFAVPCALLLFRSFKHSGAGLAALGGWLIAMHWIETYWLVIPEIGYDATPHAVDVLALITVVACAILTLRAIRRRGITPA